jgi:carbamoyltransferase
VLWRGAGTSLELLHRIEIPHSLGWFYAAMTEYLGFEAYDGEYKVMGWRRTGARTRTCGGNWPR